MPANKRTMETASMPKGAHPARAPAPRRPIAAVKSSVGADFPAAGPHAKPHLTDPDKTPGAGTLADPALPRDADATG